MGNGQRGRRRSRYLPATHVLAGHGPAHRASIDAVQLLVFELSSRRFAVAASQVEQVTLVVKVVPLPGAPSVVEGVIDVHGAVVPVFDVRARFELPSRPIGAWDHLVIARAGDRRVAVRVDQVVGLVELADERLTTAEAVTRGADRVVGVARLSDGLVVVHDLGAFLTQTEAADLDASLAARAQEGAA